MDDGEEVVVGIVGGRANCRDVVGEGGEDDGDETRSKGNHSGLHEEEELGDPPQTGRLDLLVCEHGESARFYAETKRLLTGEREMLQQNLDDSRMVDMHSLTRDPLA